MTPRTVAHQAALPMKFSRQEYWSGLPLPPPGDLPVPVIKPQSSAFPALAGGFFTTEPPGKLLGPSMLLQMALFHSFFFFWLNIQYSFVYVYHIFLNVSHIFIY